MVYCNLKGGLGNMLFQIAAAKSLSIDLGVNCSFPNLRNQLDFLNYDKTYNPTLNHALEYNKIFGGFITDLPPVGTPVIQFPFEYIKHKTLETEIVIDGFFQSEKYFLNNREQILEFLKIPVSVGELINEVYSNRLGSRLSSIHIRRGDYINHPNHHPIQELGYYSQGMELLKDKTDTWLIFSDDINWCKLHFLMDNVIFIENEKDYIELYLMSLCNNNIISNSSFSWWGAWLNKNENKIVIGPSKWFGPSIKHNTNDVIPSNWVKI